VRILIFNLKSFKFALIGESEHGEWLDASQVGILGSVIRLEPDQHTYLCRDTGICDRSFRLEIEQSASALLDHEEVDALCGPSV
jgi:hypothetical protein